MLKKRLKSINKEFLLIKNPNYYKPLLKHQKIQIKHKIILMQFAWFYKNKLFKNFCRISGKYNSIINFMHIKRHLQKKILSDKIYNNLIKKNW